jgi:prephenate dehydrogenase
MGSRAVITDVSSVKGPICEEAKRLRLLRFVGGHPMAGGEGRGFAASSRSLFRGRPWILTPASSRAAARTVREMVAATGATSVRMDAAAHDRAVAFLSHAPQIVAWALRSAAREDPTARRHLRVAGPGYRDMTRLARSPRRLWRDILRQNEREVVRAVDALQRALARTLAGVAEIRPRPLRSLLSSSSRRVSP